MTDQQELPSEKLSYSSSGVNREKADELVQSITGMAKKTLDKKVVSHVGGYASVYRLSKDQWIAASTDGVGTKLKLAFEWNAHDGVGQDLVAMSVNDLVCVGATPLFFLDYFATGRLNSDVAKRVIQGIAQGCKLARCALVGGETAEMPGMYADGEYDLAGFAVGALQPKIAIPLQKGANKIKPGDVLIGLESTGFHSNGFSLIRKILDQLPEHIHPFSSKEERNRALMAPTRIYVQALSGLIQKQWIKGAAHITGSGFLNVPRMSTAVDYRIELPSLNERPQVYQWLEGTQRLTFEEANQTFNMGIGMVLVVDPKKVTKVLAALKKYKIKTWELGTTQKKKSKSCAWVHVHSGIDHCELKY